MQFILNGPTAPDGKPYTGDDIVDPGAGLLPDAPAPGGAGPAELAPGDLAALHQVRYPAPSCTPAIPACVPTCAAPRWPAMQRTNDRPRRIGARRDRRIGISALALAFDSPSAVDEPLFLGAQVAARERALNFAGVHAMWSEVDQYCAAHNLKSTRGMEAARRDFDNVIKALYTIQLKAPAYRLLTAPILFYHG